MVLDIIDSAQTQPKLEDSECDVCSYDSSSEDSDDCKDIALQNEPPVPSFGNVAVSNSSNVHFGNKTYYQGPVSIKQILYTTPREQDGVVLKISDSIGKENGAFEPDHLNNGIGFKDDHKVDNQAQKEVKIESKWLKVLTDKRFFVTTVVILIILVTIVTLLTILIVTASTAKYDGITDSEEQENLLRTTSEDEPKVLKPYRCLVPTILVSIFLVACTVFLTLFLTKSSTSTADLINLFIDNENNTGSGKVKIYSRDDWISQPPVKPLKLLRQPVEYVYISQTNTESCTNRGACILIVRFQQNDHIEAKGLWDIKYNFLVGGDGCAYEGRGWKYEGSHTYNMNSKSIGIAFLGTFSTEKPPAIQIEAAQKLIQRGVNSGYIAPDYILRLSTDMPDSTRALKEVISTWPHWQEN